jgi:putative PIN family toxin of toxin-antitoxin system
MIKAVLDTNVVVSAHLNPDGREALILELALGRQFRCFASEELLEEYEGVLRRARFGLDPKDISRSLRIIRGTFVRAIPRRRLEVTRDPDDNRVLECALEARADYLVTGNIRHFPSRFQDVRTLLPRDFLTIMASEIS